MKKVFFLCLLLASTSAMLAQPLTAQVSSPTTASVYAQQQIDLLAGFEATTGGFEAKIKLPEVTAGRWSTPLLWTPYQRTNNGITGMVGIHTHVLPTGDVLSWEGHNDNANQGHLSHAYVWNTNPNARITSNYNYPNIYSHYDNDDSNIFCSGHSFLPDGRLLVAGGHYSDGVIDRAADPLTNQPTLQNGASNPDFIPPVGSNVNSYVGLRDANIFNYKNVTYPPSPTRVWQTPATGGYLPLMAYRRWYPTATTLADGRVLVTAGQRHGGPLGTNTTIQAEIPEVYNATTNAWQSLSTAPRRLPLYPWMFQAPDGRVFNAGPNVHTGFLNPTGTGAWAAGPSHILGGTRAPATNTPNPYDYQERVAGTAVMYQPGKIMILGGNGPTGVTNTTELLNLNAATLAWQQGPPMQFARYHANATLLANGTVLVTGGSALGNSSDAPAVLPAELWWPGNKLNPVGTWTTLNALDVPRLYHSTAVLLPDATVLTTGGGQGGGFTDHPDYQIFTPPYLCQSSARPVIASAPLAVAYGQTFTVRSLQAADVTRATWVRLSSVTHSFNMNQLFMDLNPTYDAGNPELLTITAPTNPNLCPPGHYMLFLLNSAGVPSVASIMAVNTPANTCTSVLSLTQTLVSETKCDRITRFALVGGSAAACQWVVDGVAVSNTSTSLDLTTDINKPTVQVRVEQGPGCGASANLTSYFPLCSVACNPCNPPRPIGTAPATSNPNQK